MSKTSKINKKYCARIMLEAETPLHIGSGDSDVTLDSPINTDANGYPRINGTSLAGVLRSSFDDESFVKMIFGFSDEKKPENSEGSRLMVSNAHLVYGENKVVEGLMVNETPFLSQMHNHALPLRDHCLIGHKGAAEQNGKFDTTVLPKGVRFLCELELTEENNLNFKEEWEKLIATIASPYFRIGGKTRSGLGKLKVIAGKSCSRIFDFSNSADKTDYCNCSSSFNVKPDWSELKVDNNVNSTERYYTYTLDIQPEDFFLFGGGPGDVDGEEVDMTAKTERFVTWNSGNPTISNQEKLLIPASSIKGALSHRVAFHYNKIKGFWADEIDDISEAVGNNNKAVPELFGFIDGDNKNGKRGRVIIDDMFINKNGEKTFNHVAIDRFTGGAIDGALYDEHVPTNENTFSTLKILVEKDAFKDKKGEIIRQAFENTLDDLCNGMLPLGGGVMRGHGCFEGKWEKENGGGK